MEQVLLLVQQFSEITSASNITLSANANIYSATLTFTDDVFGQADLVDSGLTVTLREAHDPRHNRQRKDSRYQLLQLIICIRSLQ